MSGGGGETSSQQQQAYNQTYMPPEYAYPASYWGAEGARKLMYVPYQQFPWTPYNPFNEEGDWSKNILTGQFIPRWDVLTQPTTSSIAPLNQQQITSMGNIANWANQPSSILGTASKQLTDTMGGSYLNPNSNPFLAQYAQQAMGDVARNYSNSIVPQLSAAATRAGAFGGSGDTLMRTEAMRNLGDTLSKTATGIYEPAYEAERNRQLQAQFYAPTLDTAYLPHYQAGLAAGDIARQAQQDYLTEAYNNWARQIQWPYMAGAASAGVYSPFAGGYGTTTGSGASWGTQTMSGASPFSQIMGGAMSGLGLLGGLF